MIALMSVRQSKGLTQKQLADLSGVTQQNISLIERGQNPNVGILTLVALARGLGCSLEDLYRADEDEPESKGA